MWKVPFRPVYTETFPDLVKFTYWYHIVLRLFPFAHNFGVGIETEEVETDSSEKENSNETGK